MDRPRPSKAASLRSAPYASTGSSNNRPRSPGQSRARPSAAGGLKSDADTSMACPTSYAQVEDKTPPDSTAEEDTPMPSADVMNDDVAAAVVEELSTEDRQDDGDDLEDGFPRTPTWEPQPMEVETSKASPVEEVPKDTKTEALQPVAAEDKPDPKTSTVPAAAAAKQGAKSQPAAKDPKRQPAKPTGLLEVKFKGGSKDPTKELALNGLPYSISPMVLKSIFSAHGFELAQLPRTFAGLSGCRAAVATLASAEEACKALDVLNGKPVESLQAAKKEEKGASKGSGKAVASDAKGKSAGAEASKGKQEYGKNSKGSGSPYSRDSWGWEQSGWTGGWKDDRGYGKSWSWNRQSDGKGGRSWEESAAGQQAWKGGAKDEPTKTVTPAEKEQPEQVARLSVQYADNPHLPSPRLRVDGLPKEMGKGELEDLLSKRFGIQVVHARPLPTKPGVQTHAMHVELRSKLDAAQAIDMLNDFVLQDAEAETKSSAAEESTQPGKSAGQKTRLQTEAGTLLVTYANDSGDACNSIRVIGLPVAKMHPGVVHELCKTLDCEVSEITFPMQDGQMYAKVTLASKMEAASVIEALSGQPTEVVDALLEQTTEEAAAPAPVASAPPQAATSRAQARPRSPPKPRVAQQQKAAKPAPSLKVTHGGTSEVMLRGSAISQANEETLKQIFVNLGLHPARATLLRDSAGSAVVAARVKLASAAECATAISALDGQEV